MESPREEEVGLEGGLNRNIALALALALSRSKLDRLWRPARLALVPKL
jgi:hypothetical protein